MKHRISIYSVAFMIVICCEAAHAGPFSFVEKAVKDVGRSIDKHITQPIVAKPLKDIREEVIEEVTNTDKDDLIRQIKSKYATARSEVLKARAKTVSQFKMTLIDFDQSIAELEIYGIDPTRVRTEDGSLMNLFSQRAKIVIARDAAINEFDQNLADMSKNERSAIDEINKKYRG